MIGVILIVVLIIGLGALAYAAISQNSQPDETNGTEEATTEETMEEDDNMSRFNSRVQADMNRIFIEINNYAADNNGRAPFEQSEIEAFEQNYLAGLDNHPVSDLPYTIDETKFETHQYITYGQGACSGEGFIERSDSTRQFALAKELPGGQMYCIDNS